MKLNLKVLSSGLLKSSLFLEENQLKSFYFIPEIREDGSYSKNLTNQKVLGKFEERLEVTQRASIVFYTKHLQCYAPPLITD